MLNFLSLTSVFLSKLDKSVGNQTCMTRQTQSTILNGSVSHHSECKTTFHLTEINYMVLQ